MHQIYRRIRITVFLFLIIISLSIFFGIYRPLTTQLDKVLTKNYTLLTDNKHKILEAFVAGSRYNAAALSSRSVIRDMLGDYLDGKVSFEELKSFTEPRYTDGVKVFDQLSSAARFSIDRRLIYSTDSDINLEEKILWDEKEIISRFIPDNNMVLVQSPIKKGETIIGYDIILADAGPTVELIEEGLYKLSFISEKRKDEVKFENKKITSYLDCEILGGTIVLSADEGVVFKAVRDLTARNNIWNAVVLIVIFLITQYLIVRYIRSFVTTQEKLKAEAEEREKEIKTLYDRLKESEELLRMTLDVTGEGIWDWHIEEGIVYHNKRWCEILGLDESYLSHSIEVFSERVYTDDRQQVLEAVNKAIEEHKEYLSEHRMTRYDGSIIWVVDRGAAIISSDGKIRRMIGSISDITISKNAQLNLFLEKEIFKSTLLSVGDGIISTDKDGIIKVINPIAKLLIGCNEEDTERNIEEIVKLIHPETRKPIKWEEIINSQTTSATNVAILVSCSGYDVFVFKTVTPIFLPNGEITGYVMVLKDVTELLNQQKKIEYLSFHDELSGLYNRRYMEDALHRLDVKRNLPFTIMMFDLNNLKLANDVFGHEMGDGLIKKTAELLRDIFRADDIIARIGGDEFCVLMPKTSKEVAKMVQERILNVMEHYRVGPFRLSIAFGYAVKTDISEEINVVMQAADSSMYQNKQENRQKVRKRTLDDFIENNYIKFEQEQAHNSRVGILACSLYEALGKSPEEVNEFKLVAQIHDIGKVMVPAEILNKKDPLTESDWEKLRQHSQAGYHILHIIKEYEDYAEAILYHHERFDGKGYPEGVAGYDIPLEARIITIADAYEAMTANRPYRRGKTKEEAILELRSNADTQFDGELVEIFIEKVLSSLS